MVKQTKTSSNIFTYRVLKTTWGISIEINAERLPKDRISDSYQALSQYLYVDESLKWLSEDEKYFLLEGLNLASEPLVNFFGQEFVVLVSNIDFSYTDYQEEGLAMALAGWLNRFFALPLKEIEVKFSKDLNKYVFVHEGEIILERQLT